MEQTTPGTNLDQASFNALSGAVKGTSGWLMFFAVLAYISAAGYALITVIALIAGIAMAVKLGGAGALSLLLVPLYGLVAVVAFWIGRVLAQASQRGKQYAATGSISDLIEYTKKLKTYFTIYGVLTIIALGLMVLAIIVGTIVGLGSLGSFM